MGGITGGSGICPPHGPAQSGFSSGFAYLAGALARSGRDGEAREIAARLLRMEPAFSSRSVAAIANGDELQRRPMDVFAAA
jgi:hypothetical protein